MTSEIQASRPAAEKGEPASRPESFAEHLIAAQKEGKVILLDGGLATELERRGYSLDDPLWSARLLLEEPHAIADVHLDYLCAGARILTTATYQATYQGLKAKGLSTEEATDLFRLSVDLAVKARQEFWASLPQNSPQRSRPIWIAASIGPYGAALCDGSEYRGNYGLSRRELTEFHRERVETLAATPADVLAFETFPSLLEAESVLPLIRAGSKPAWISFTCKNETSLCHGEPVEEAAELVEREPAVVAVGINCTAPRFGASLIQRLASRTSKPIIVYPNSGETWNGAQRRWMGDAPVENWFTLAEHWRDAGATVIGGCCRTTPQHIASMKSFG